MANSSTLLAPALPLTPSRITPCVPLDGRTTVGNHRSDPINQILSTPCAVCGKGSKHFNPDDWNRVVELPAAEKCDTCPVIIEGVRLMQKRFHREGSSKPSVTARFDGGKLPHSVGIYQGGQTRFIEFYVLPETPSPWPSMNHLPSIIELDESVRRIRSWMQICQRGHKECSRNLKSGLPTRVVDVGAIDNELIRLHTTAQGDTGPFTALSYCWGDKGNLTTTKDNLNAHGQAILWSCIPQVMKDAIYITRQLGIQYIWIDALCIVQDDSQDWDREAAQMQDIYRKACLVISGTRTGNCHQSLFGRRTSSATNYGERVPASFATEQVVVRTNQPTVHIREKLGHDLLNEQLKQDLEEHPLLSRGWTFQERLLATRTAHFTASEIMWECKESYWCECSSIETKDARSLLQRALQEPGKASVNWRKLVGAYSWRVFTHPQDRLAALEGVASLFKAFDLGSYCFGLWGDHIIDHMLWKAISIDSRSEVPEAYRSVILGPSWSWISTYQRVDFPSVSHPVAVLVGDAPTVPSTLGVREAICYPPSPLKLWTLTLRTKVRRGVFEHEPCQNQECRYRILLESPEPRANWVAVDFYPDIILCPEHRLAGSDLVRAKWLEQGQVVECILLADGVFRSEWYKNESRRHGNRDSQSWRGLVVKESQEEPGVYFRAGFVTSEWVTSAIPDPRPRATRSRTVWDGVEEREITLV